MEEHIKLLYRAWKYRLVDNPEEISYLLRTISRGATVLDVGAHKGGYTYWMRKAVGPSGKVIAFEPQQKGARLLEQLFKEPNVQVVHKALSNKAGQQELFIQLQRFDVSFEASLENKYGNTVTEVVDTTTIDEFCKAESLSPSFIKVDVEGHEEQVLEGASQVLKTCRPVLLVECEVRLKGHYAIARLISFLKSLQYSGFFYRKGQRLPAEAFDPRQDQRAELAGSREYINNFYFEPNGQL